MLASMNRRKEIIASLNRLKVESSPKFRKELSELADALQELLDSTAKGGRARAKKLSKKRRSEIARNAARARWSKV
jgi:ElaB/YqjD/DUF883 family membrane-anchored ribosome-binding protein